MEQPNTKLIIPLGKDHQRRIDQLNRIKEAMAVGIMLLVENGMADDDPDSIYRIFTLFYLEANSAEHMMRR